jgi:capsular polysaccharide biosynthesis protein
MKKIMNYLCRLYRNKKYLILKALGKITDIDEYAEKNKDVVYYDKFYKNNALPENINQKALLSKVYVGGFNYSYYDTVNKLIKPSFILKLENVVVIKTDDGYQNPFFSMYTEKGEFLTHRGLKNSKEAGEMYQKYKKNSGECRVFDSAAYCLRGWVRNYYHWYVDTMPCIFLAENCIPTIPLLLPSTSQMTPVMNGTLDTVDCDFINMNKGSDIIKVKELYYVENYLAHNNTDTNYRKLINLNNKFSTLASTKIFISRKNAHWRRLCAEDTIEEILQERGWTLVCFEDYTYSEQIGIASQAKAIAGVHGAGLTNMIFAQPGTHVLEINLKERPNPDYYYLASTLGHRYWLLEGTRANTRTTVKHDDVMIDTHEFKCLIDQIDKQLTA